MDSRRTGTDKPVPVELGKHLTGFYRVRVFRPAWGDARRLLPRTRDCIELRAHALKLRYWPEKNPEAESGDLLDLNWSWIRALGGLKIGELRIDDKIGGNDNLRVIFFCGDPKVKEPLPFIWILGVIQKKRMEFTAHQIQIWRDRRTLVIERFYKYRELK